MAGGNQAWGNGNSDSAGDRAVVDPPQQVVDYLPDEERQVDVDRGGRSFVGDIVKINPGIIERLLAEDLIPVISSIGADTTGQAYNINADTVASAIAGALEAEKVIYLTDVPGLLTDVDDESSIVARADIADLEALIADGTISGGMIPKKSKQKA